MAQSQAIPVSKELCNQSKIEECFKNEGKKRGIVFQHVEANKPLSDVLPESERKSFLCIDLPDGSKWVLTVVWLL